MDGGARAAPTRTPMEHAHVAKAKGAAGEGEAGEGEAGEGELTYDFWGLQVRPRPATVAAACIRNRDCHRRRCL